MKEMHRLLIIAIWVLFYLGVPVNGIAQKDTTKVGSVLAPIGPVKKGKESSKVPPKDNSSKEGSRKPVTVDRPAAGNAYFGQFTPLIEQSLLNNVLILEQQYIITDGDGSDIELTSDAGVPVLSVGMVIGNQVLASMNTVRPWQNDARLAQLDKWENPRFGDLRYRQLEDGARWGEAKTFAIDSIDRQFSVYSGLRFNSKLDAVEGNEVAKGVLMLIGYDKGGDPMEAEWHLDFTSVTPDWENAGAPVKIPELGKVYVGGFYLYPDISPGTIVLRVAGVLEVLGSETVLKAITEPKLLNTGEGLKKSSRSDDNDKKRRKKKKKKRRRRGRG